MKPNEEQSRMLKDLQRKNQQIKIQRIESRLRLEKLLEEELAVLLVEQSQLANRALVAGVSKSRIGMAMGTTNGGTVNNVLALAARPELEPEEVTAITSDDGWRYDKATGVLTLTKWRNLKEQPETGQLEIPLELDVAGALQAKDWRHDVYDRKVHTTWFTDLLHGLNVSLGLKQPHVELELEPAQTDPYANAAEWATNRDWEEED